MSSGTRVAADTCCFMYAAVSHAIAIAPWVTLPGAGQRERVEIHQPVVSDARDELRRAAGGERGSVGEHQHARPSPETSPAYAASARSIALPRQPWIDDVELEPARRAALAPLRRRATVRR